MTKLADAGVPNALETQARRDFLQRVRAGYTDAAPAAPRSTDTRTRKAECTSCHETWDAPVRQGPPPTRCPRCATPAQKRRRGLYRSVDDATHRMGELARAADEKTGFILDGVTEQPYTINDEEKMALQSPADPPLPTAERIVAFLKEPGHAVVTFKGGGSIVYANGRSYIDASLELAIAAADRDSGESE